MLFVYLAIPVQFWLIWAEWYGLFIVFVPVYMFMFLGAAMADGETLAMQRGSLGGVNDSVRFHPVKRTDPLPS